MNSPSVRRQVLLVTLLAMATCLYIQKNVFLAPQLHRNDFKHLYIGAFLVGHGIGLYDPKSAFWAKDTLHIPGGLNPFVYPPFMAVLCKPLAWLSYDAAWLAWCALNHVLLILTLTLFCKLWPSEDLLSKLTIGVALLALYDPIFRTISAGQFNIILLFAYTLSLLLWRRGNCVAAGAVIGLVAAAKVAPGLLLVLFLLVDRRAFFAGLAALCVCTVLAVAVAGWNAHVAFLELLPHMSYGRSIWQPYYVEPHNQAPSALFYRLLTVNPKTIPLVVAPTAAYLLSVLTAGFLIGATLFATRRCRNDKSLLFILWIYPMLLIPSLCWDHYFTQLLLPIWILASRWETHSMKRAVVFAVAVGVLSVPYAFQSEWWKAGTGIFGASLKCYAAIGLFALTLNDCCWRQRST